MGRKAQDGEIVAANLLTLILVDGTAQRLLLLAHRHAEILLEQLLKAPLAERAAARSADLVDQAVGGEVERIAVVEREGVIGVGRFGRIAAVAQSLAIALDLDDVFLVGAPQREPRAGKADLALVGLDEANARLEAVVGLAALLVLAEQALHAAVQALQHLAWLVA